MLEYSLRYVDGNRFVQLLLSGKYRAWNGREARFFDDLEVAVAWARKEAQE